jgi:DNA replication ATP-dependent helicase Dna2
MRLGRPEKVHPQVRHFLMQAQVADMTDPAALAEFYATRNVVATTCLGWSHPVLRRRTFDYCIVDEASQITQAVCLGPIQAARVFVLVGDHYQLPPLVQNADARAQGMGTSLFKRLCEAHPHAVVTLDHQYRMNAAIMGLANAVIYSEQLKCGSAEIATARLDVSVGDGILSSLPPWLQSAVSPAQTVLFLDTDAVRWIFLSMPRNCCLL